MIRLWHIFFIGNNGPVLFYKLERYFGALLKMAPILFYKNIHDATVKSFEGDPKATFNLQYEFEKVLHLKKLSSV